MSKIGILGGTFNPPHIGHLIIANEVYSKLELDLVWFMPNNKPPHKSMTGNASKNDRLKMLKLATKSHPGFSIQTIELEREGPSYTFDTMKTLAEMHPDTEFYFIIGGDMVEYLPNWKNIDALLRLVNFVGVSRPSFQTDSPYPIIHMDTPLIEISSSDIRQRIRDGKTIRYLVTDDIREYIEENGLYES
ncbi:nicotinate-nucleotide adenylyltransferase [Bacillus massilinigeriensis]|uniref:nicotinate-nucleotide adenylyltransferase n=1 Tax=Bacillus mediterraneensis TaxID=1805474 RepID=UPI0008F87562|nr:nicotinate-nucleotide adenylyltransferase [Bacillus mediterraneensis]